jgi:hypothetical protein
MLNSTLDWHQDNTPLRSQLPPIPTSLLDNMEFKFKSVRVTALASTPSLVSMLRVPPLSPSLSNVVIVERRKRKKKKKGIVLSLYLN